MSEGRYTFVPWIRRGVSALGAISQAEISISFGQGRSADVTLPLTGPADITGLDARVVSRTWPRRHAGEVEPNLFPLIEFDQPDIPWRYSPAAPASDRLRPWAVLLALADNEIASFASAGGRRPLPAVAIDGAPLPSLNQSWAWAHAQVTRTDNDDDGGVEQVLASAPHRVVSRLLCPRRLRADTRYTVVLVPAFEAGRRAGLGEPTDGVDALTPAWEPGASVALLPVYYRWSFTTGAGGDFEQLARRLSPAPAPAHVGAVAMDASQPGGDLPPAAAEPMSFEGALRSPALSTSAWDEAERAPFVSALASWLNRPADLLDTGIGTRAVAPPLYARWHAGEERHREGEAPVWFNELNADPRLRAAAGLGAEVVRRDQHNLMAAAWQQLPGLSEVNDGLRVAQLAREVSASLLARHIDPADADATLTVTAPVHARMRASPTTVAARLADSPVPSEATGATVRALSRALGPVSRRQARDPNEPSVLLARLNRRELDPAPVFDAPEQLPTLARVGQSLADPTTTASTVGRLMWVSRVAAVLAMVLLVAGAVGAAVGLGWAVVAIAAVAAVVTEGVSSVARRSATRLGRAIGVRDGTLSSASVESVAVPPSFTVRESSLTGGDDAPAPPSERQTQAFRAAAVAMVQAWESSRAETVAAPAPVRLEALAAGVVAAVDPRQTIERAVARRLDIAGELAWNPVDPIEPVLAGPEFDRPMYRSLAELSPSWLLPGADAVVRNTVSLLQTNPRFVEAYLVGANHEMCRELLWREFPTNPQKTYFRRFWDPVAPSQGPRPAPDIEPIHTWGATSSLGEHRPSRPAGAQEQLVLLVRGDVVHRYPDLEVYAARAQWSDTDRGLTDDLQPPVFAGRLSEDMAFYGFDLTYTEARGDEGEVGEGDPGWFFVVQERAGETRFGLDAIAADAGPARHWSDLSWDHVREADEDTFEGYVDLDAQRPDTRLVEEPGGAAWHGDAGLGPTGARGSDLAFITLQTPMRVAFHARDLLVSTDAD